MAHSQRRQRTGAAVVRGLLVLAGCAAMLAPAGAAEAAKADSATAPARVRVGTIPPPPSAFQAVAAHYRVRIETRGADGRRVWHSADWYFYREAERIALVKGAVEDLWLRDAGGLRFERVFHADRRVIDYSAGELATLGVAVDWQALSGFVDLTGWVALKAAGADGTGATRILRFSGMQRGQAVSLRWSPALGLPTQIERRDANGLRVRHELVASAPVPRPDWPLPGARSADYLHIDAADFGDMAYDPVVRKAEALDVLAGWRRAHGAE